MSLEDLDGIWNYITEDLCSPTSAKNVVNGIISSIDKLADFPAMGVPLSSVSEIDSDYRFLVCGNYMVFYRAMNTDVYIDRILYGRCDYLQILMGNGDGK